MNNQNTTSSQSGKNCLIRKILTGILFFIPVFALIILFLFCKNAYSHSWLNCGPLVFLVLLILGLAIWLYIRFLPLDDPNKQSLTQPFPFLRYLAVSGLCAFLLECLGMLWDLLKPGEITGKGKWLWETFFNITKDTYPPPVWGTFWLALLPILSITLLIIVSIKALSKIIKDE